MSYYLRPLGRRYSHTGLSICRRRRRGFLTFPTSFLVALQLKQAGGVYRHGRLRTGQRVVGLVKGARCEGWTARAQASVFLSTSPIVTASEYGAIIGGEKSPFLREG